MWSDLKVVSIADLLGNYFAGTPKEKKEIGIPVTKITQDYSLILMLSNSFLSIICQRYTRMAPQA
jgi:hypothetical protein